MAGSERVGAERAGGIEQVAELDLLVAADARDGGLAAGIAEGEIVDHTGLEAGFIIQHVMRDTEPAGNRTGVGDVGAGAAAAGLAADRAVVIEPQGRTDDVVTLLGE